MRVQEQSARTGPVKDPAVQALFITEYKGYNTSLTSPIVGVNTYVKEHFNKGWCYG